MKEITTKNFIDAWKEFVTKNEKKLILNFTEKITRTEAIIGRSRRSLTKSPFGNFITEYFNNEIEYRTEESSIDIVIAEKNKFQLSDIKTKTKVNKGFYPCNYDIILESENMQDRTHEEMIKLTRYKAKLKVLLTYAYPIDGGIDTDYDAKRKLSQNYKEIIISANNEFPENIHTRYLLIIGQREKEKDSTKKIHWEIYVFDTKGNIKESENIK